MKHFQTINTVKIIATLFLSINKLVFTFETILILLNIKTYRLTLIMIVNIKALQGTQKERWRRLCRTHLFKRHSYLVHWLYHCVLKFRYLENIHALKTKNWNLNILKTRGPWVICPMSVKFENTFNVIILSLDKII